MIRHLYKTYIHLLIAFFITGFCLAAYASDLAKEKRMKDQVADYVMDGDVILLKDGSHEFLSIYMEADEQPAKGAVIIIHGRGYHPNWPELVYPLRTGLPEYGWNTLSIQMPVLSNESSFYDYMKILPQSHPRMESAVYFLKQKGLKNIIILAHSCGVHMAFDWLHKNPAAGISAFIGVGMGSTDYGQPMLKPFALDDIKIPVLDIRGENDFPAVQRNAPRRMERIKRAGNPKSQQRVVAKSDHYFTDRGDDLLKEVTKWLDTLK